ncbi:hypothetical protein QFC19_006445 [Naganishia cerealis]|uniref:Uncharacterized protein n=1 Tax=Naganishia cerealis TaxID=610337 RepID=A0ACC2VI79_9TREE|nr:hypothetical protein QFC19_006445 [Naganishia cerealis]
MAVSYTDDEPDGIMDLAPPVRPRESPGGTTTTTPTISSAPALVLSIRGLAGLEVIVIGKGTADFDNCLPAPLPVLMLPEEPKFPPVCVLLSDVESVGPPLVRYVRGDE